jgi:hypothetical protein
LPPWGDNGRENTREPDLSRCSRHRISDSAACTAASE